MSGELRKDEKEIGSKVDPKSVDALFEFYKDTFDMEERRKDTLENKASMVLGFSGIIAGLITGLLAGSLSSNPIILIIFFSSVLSFTISGLFALLTVKLKNYMAPFNALTPELIDDLVSKDPVVLRNEIVKNYSDALINNQTLNNQKAKHLVIAFYSATIGIAMTLITSILAALI